MDKNVIKKVNVYPKRPIFFGNKEIRQNQLGIQMSVGDIFQCLLAMAKVEEVNESEETTELHLSDFYGQNWTKEEEDDPEVIKISPANGDGKTVYTTKQRNVNNNTTTTTKTETPNTTTTTKTETPNTTTTTTTKTETPNNTNSNKK